MKKTMEKLMKKIMKPALGRNRGENNNNAKITDVDVLAIRKSYKDGTNTVKELSVKYNLSAIAVYKIISKERWKHI